MRGRTVVASAVVMGLAIFLAATEGAAKPQAPVEISLSAVPSSGEKRTAQVVLHVRPLVDAPKIRVAFILPDGVTVVSGDEVWEGSLAKGELRDLQISVRMPDHEASVIVGSATIQYPDGARLGGSAAVTVRSP